MSKRLPTLVIAFLLSAIVPANVVAAESGSPAEASTPKGRKKTQKNKESKAAKEKQAEAAKLAEEEAARAEEDKRREEAKRTEEERAAEDTQKQAARKEEESAAIPARSATDASKPAKPWTIALAAQYYGDSASLDRKFRASILTEDSKVDVDNDQSFALSLEALAPLSKNLRLGAGVRYFFDYRYRPKPTDNNKAPDAVLLGQLLELNGRADLLIPLNAKVGLHLGLQGGPAILFADGALQTDIDAYAAQGIDVWDVPRLGVQLGPQFGATYRLLDNLAVRAEFGLSWQRLFLFSTSDTVARVDVELSRTLAIRRGSLSVGLELAL